MTPSKTPPPTDPLSLGELLAARHSGESTEKTAGNTLRQELESLSVQDLRRLARELGLTGYSQDRKAELVKRLQAADRAARSREARRSSRAAKAGTSKRARESATRKSTAQAAPSKTQRKAATTKPATRASTSKPPRKSASTKPVSKSSTAKPATKAGARKPALESPRRKSTPKAFATKPTPKAISPKSSPKAFGAKTTPKALGRKTTPKTTPKSTSGKPAPKAAVPKLAPDAATARVAAPPLPPPTEFARSPLGPPSESPLPPAAPPPAERIIEERLPSHIPWGYGRDRATAMAVDPQELYVYAEITDDGIAQARRALGAEGEDARLVLRIHDVSGRIFDGTNSHGFVDTVVDRDQRGWFLDVARPGSTAIAEIGLRGASGRFGKIARSRRVDFARSGSTVGAPEWMTVVAAPSGRPEPVILARGNGHAAGAAAGGAPAIPESGFQPAATAVIHEFGAAEEVEWIPAPHLDVFVGTEAYTEDVPGPTVPGEAMTWGWVESWPLEGLEHRESRWFVSPEGWSWIGGPYERWSVTGPVTIWEVIGEPEYFEGPAGQRIRFGRWSVEIKGIDGWAERRRLGGWSMSQSWAVAGGAESIEWQGAMSDPRLGGSSDLRWQGSSERRWRGASELRLGGASELIRRGASELRLGGSSELIRRGASERRWGYGSEQRWLGASERRQRGGSERRLGGASERRRPARPGGSEGRFPGASERRLGGASERQARRSRPPQEDGDARRD